MRILCRSANFFRVDRYYDRTRSIPRYRGFAVSSSSRDSLPKDFQLANTLFYYSVLSFSRTHPTRICIRIRHDVFMKVLSREIQARLSLARERNFESSTYKTVVSLAHHARCHRHAKKHSEAFNMMFEKNSRKIVEFDNCNVTVMKTSCGHDAPETSKKAFLLKEDTERERED